MLLVRQVLWTYGLLKDSFFRREIWFVARMRSLRFYWHNLSCFPVQKTWASKKSSTKRGSLLQRWHCCVLISCVSLWLHWCRHGEGVAFRNLQWRFPDEGKLLHVKLNLFYVYSWTFFLTQYRLWFSIVQRARCPFPAELLNNNFASKRLITIEKTWKILKDICCIHVYTLMIF